MDRIKSLELFVRVAEAGGFTAVGRERSVSQSSVSRTVSDLEKWLGVQLFQRTTREVKLTEAGEELYNRSVALLSVMEDIESSVSGMSKKPVGVLRLQAPNVFGRTHVVPYVLEFLTQYPDTSIDLRLNDQRVNLVEDGVDVAIRIGNLVDQNIIAKKLGRDTRHVVASPTYLQQHGTPVRPRDLGQHSCIVYSFLDTPNQWRFTGPEGIENVTVSGRIRANSGDAMRAAVLADHGVAILGNYAVGTDLADGKMRKLLPEFSVEPLDIQIIYAPTRHLPRKARTFIDFYAARLKQTGLFKD